ncbi:MAG: hypothetical protein KGJ60_12955 [Verrucomicrobiota bacterium]|nr:hypothetical protein [Verrucomicrobiota bacterium]
MRFPKVIRHRKAVATIYGRSKNYPYYRLAYYAAGKRHVRHFSAFGEAKPEAERIVRELADGSQAAALTAAQSRDALAALERLQAHYQATGRRVSLLASVSAYCEADAKLNGQTLLPAVQGYLQSVASVKRMDIAEAVDEFLQTQTPRTKVADGHRAQLSKKQIYVLGIRLGRFAATFPNTAVSDLNNEHLDAFMGALDKVKSKSDKRAVVTSAKTRNHYRAAVGQFFRWCVRKDYLPMTHRLLEADSMRPEHANTAEIHFYTPRELTALLVNADEALRPLLAIGGLAGLRTAEMLRLDWQDVWRVPGHIEVTAGKSKTRQRRLVEICPALQAWLESYRVRERGKFWLGEERTFLEHYRDLCEMANIPRKENGLRHAFCTYHFALHANENLTAAQAGNSPAMIHAHYKGMATKAEAEKWFNVLPPESARNVIPLADTRNQAQ